MLRLSRILVLSLLFTLLPAACSVPDAPPIGESSPAPVAILPSSTAEAETNVARPTTLSAETTPATSTTSALAETTVLPAESSSTSPMASAEGTNAATVAPQPINLSPDPIASTHFRMQSTIALTVTLGGIIPLNWSPDGTQLLFRHLSELWLYNVTTDAQQLLLDNVRIATWSPDGQRVAYVPGWNQALGMEDRRVLVLDLTTNQSVEIGDTQARGPIASQLVWTPDRGIILATPQEILAYPDTTRTAPPVMIFAFPPTVEVTDNLWIALAPDGRHALIASGAPRERRINFVVDGALVKTIVVDYPTSPLWSPDGQRVVFEHAGEFLSIYSAQGDLLATSTPETLKLRPLDWSPDGAYLVYSTNGGGTGPFQAYLVKPGGSGSVEIVPPFTSSDGISDALWSPNNRHIAYTVGDYAAVGEEPTYTTTYLMIATLANP